MHSLEVDKRLIEAVEAGAESYVAIVQKTGLCDLDIQKGASRLEKISATLGRIHFPWMEKPKATTSGQEPVPLKRLWLIEPVSARLDMGGMFTISGYGQEMRVSTENALELGYFLLRTAQAVQAR